MPRHCDSNPKRHPPPGQFPEASGTLLDEQAPRTAFAAPVASVEARFLLGDHLTGAAKLGGEILQFG